MKDTHADLCACHKSMSESYSKLAEKCVKADEADFTKMVTAITGAVLENVDKKFGSVVMETGVRKVFTTEDPTGGQLIPRTGQPSPPVDLDRVPVEFRGMFQE